MSVRIEHTTGEIKFYCVYFMMFFLIESFLRSTKYQFFGVFFQIFFPEQIYTKVQSSTITETNKYKKTLQTNKNTKK